MLSENDSIYQGALEFDKFCEEKTNEILLNLINAQIESQMEEEFSDDNANTIDAAITDPVSDPASKNHQQQQQKQKLPTNLSLDLVQTNSNISFEEKKVWIGFKENIFFLFDPDASK